MIQKHLQNIADDVEEMVEDCGAGAKGHYVEFGQLFRGAGINKFFKQWDITSRVPLEDDELYLSSRPLESFRCGSAVTSECIVAQYQKTRRAIEVGFNPVRVSMCGLKRIVRKCVEMDLRGSN